MPKINKHIEIVRSPLPALSCMGRKSADMIQSLLEQHYEHVGVSLVSDLSDLESLVAKQPDLVFLGVKRVPVSSQDTAGAKVWIPAYLDEQGVAYTGSDAAAIALDFSKPKAKRIIMAAGLPTAAYFVARPGIYQAASTLPLSFPLFVKPPNGGGGKGIGPDSVVRDFAAFESKVERIEQKYNAGSLVETYLPGREFSVALLQSLDMVELMAMPIELITDQNEQGDRILGQGVKDADTERIIAVPDGAVRQAVVELATEVFIALGARDYGRIDIRLDERGLPHFLEANLIPGLAQHDFTSYFTAACRLNYAMDYQAMILHITALGLSRNAVGFQKLDDLEIDDVAPPALKPAFGVV